MCMCPGICGPFMSCRPIVLAEIPPVSGTAQIKDRNESESQYSLHTVVLLLEEAGWCW